MSSDRTFRETLAGSTIVVDMIEGKTIARKISRSTEEREREP
jgi:hypothetical protein